MPCKNLMQYYSVGNFPLGFDHEKYRKSHETHLAKTTKGLGWNARGLFDSRVSEFYTNHRILKFIKTKFIIFFLRNFVNKKKLTECQLLFVFEFPHHACWRFWSKELIIINL